MAYSVVKRGSMNLPGYGLIDDADANVKTFIMDEPIDLIRITDDCLPGSVAIVAGNPEKDIFSYIKTPSKDWMIASAHTIDRDPFNYPNNTLKIHVPTGFEKFANINISKFHSGIDVFHQSGYVTGTLKSTRFEAYAPNDVEMQKGHFFVFNIVDNVKGVKTMTLSKNGEITKKDIPYDSEVAFKVTDPSDVFKIELDNGKYFVFYFMDVVLE